MKHLESSHQNCQECQDFLKQFNDTESTIQETDAQCVRCSDFLSFSEKQYLDKNDLTYILGGYLCKRHWCTCMPHNTPWSYVRDCSLCKNSICKTCKRTDGQYYICEDCDDTDDNDDSDNSDDSDDSDDHQYG